MEISLKINGKEINANVKPNTLLSTFIRENLNLTGTHIGCDTSQCGACAIHLNGDAIKSCAYLAVQADGTEIVTIEGIANGDDLHPMQQAFHENHGLQCGYCTPGFITTIVYLLKNNVFSRRRLRTPACIDFGGLLARFGRVWASKLEPCWLKLGLHWASNCHFWCLLGDLGALHWF